MTIFKACDVRGIVNRDWGPVEAHAIGAALGGMMRERSETDIFVGADFRPTSAMLKHALIAGLTDTGARVIDVGHQPTPVVFFAARQAGCGNGAVVTASHNPPEYNGVKFMLAHQPAVPSLIDELRTRIDRLHWPTRQGRCERRDPVADYFHWLVQSFATTRDRIAPTEFPLVVDLMHGACAEIAPRVLAACGYPITVLHGRREADFGGIAPNPAQDANLAELVDAVRATSAALGIAVDGDGDRVIFVDGSGRIVRPEQIAVIFVEHCRHGSCVVYDLKCASIVPQAASDAGGTAHMQPSGYGFIKSAMQRRHADFGVEVSGHHFFASLGGGDDALFAALYLLDILRRQATSLAELCAVIGWPNITPDIRIAFTGDAAAVLDGIADTCGGRLTRLDGVRADYDNSSWALARASITEPALTFRFESRTAADLPKLVTRFLVAVPELQRNVMEKLNE